MRPEDLNILLSEGAEMPASCLPASEEADVDRTTTEVTSRLFYLLHLNICHRGRPSTIPNEFCRMLNNIFWKVDKFDPIRQHVDVCPGEHCDFPYCRRSVMLYEHWVDCKQLDCHICAPSANLLMKQFCERLLHSTNPEAKKFMKHLQESDLRAQKRFLFNHFNHQEVRE